MKILKARSYIHENKNSKNIQLFNSFEQLFIRITFEMNKTATPEAAASRWFLQ